MISQEELPLKFQTSVKDFNLFKDIETFVLLFSGGKDCTFLLDMLLKYYPYVTSKMKILCVMYPHHVYCNNSSYLPNFIEIKTYWESRGLEIDYIDTPQPDFDENDIYGCKVCKQSRKIIVDPYIDACDDGTGILTGVTLYDTLAYINMLLYHTDFNLENFENIPHDSKKFLLKTLHKIIPREILPSGKIMIRPLLRINETEIRTYLSINKIPYISTPCKISSYKFKRQYSNALDVYQGTLTSYDGIVNFLRRHKILFEELPFDQMVEDNFFIDC